MAVEPFRFGQKKYDEKGWILVDTKYEFGRDASGKILVIDEVHPPDSRLRAAMRANSQRGKPLKCSTRKPFDAICWTRDSVVTLWFHACLSAGCLVSLRLI